MELTVVDRIVVVLAVVLGSVVRDPTGKVDGGPEGWTLVASVILMVVGRMVVVLVVVSGSVTVSGGPNNDK